MISYIPSTPCNPPVYLPISIGGVLPWGWSSTGRVGVVVGVQIGRKVYGRLASCSPSTPYHCIPSIPSRDTHPTLPPEGYLSMEGWIPGVVGDSRGGYTIEGSW